VAAIAPGPVASDEVTPIVAPKPKRHIALWFGVGFLGLLVLFALFGTGLGGGIELTGKPFLPALSPNHLLGTDELGRDVAARLAYGARISLSIGLIVQVLAIFTGVLVGMLATFSPRFVRTLLQRFTDAMFAFPDILLAILLIGIFLTQTPNVKGWFGALITSGIVPVIVALGITAWPQNARLVQTVVASLKDREFVIAARALGAPTGYVVLRHILPQMWGILLAVGMVDLAGTILAESTLSFLGIGVLPPVPSWGAMIETARANMVSQPIALVWPCLILSLTIFALNFVGDGLRDLFDPRKR
jgi:ABC-type dipeptide/oligopeptide/nickel transport system permease subunit